MALVLGTNCGFVTTAPTDDPDGPDILSLGDLVWAMKVTSPATAAKITEIGWYCPGATQETNFEVAIYTPHASLDYPGGILKVERTNAKGTTAGWKRVTVDWSINASTVYWLAIQADTTPTTTNIDADLNGATRTAFDEDPGYLKDPWGIYGADSSRTVALYAVWKAVIGPFPTHFRI